VAEEVERRALGREDRGQRAGDPGELLAGGQPVAVVGRPLDVQALVQLPERLGRAAPAGEHAVGPGHEQRGGLQRRRQQGRGEVAERRQVLGQGAGDGLAHGGHRGVGVVHGPPVWRMADCRPCPP
jgi:hypothetical protein